MRHKRKYNTLQNSIVICSENNVINAIHTVCTSLLKQLLYHEIPDSPPVDKLLYNDLINK